LENVSKVLSLASELSHGFDCRCELSANAAPVAINGFKQEMSPKLMEDSYCINKNLLRSFLHVAAWGATLPVQASRQSILAIEQLCKWQAAEKTLLTKGGTSGDIEHLVDLQVRPRCHSPRIRIPSKSHDKAFAFYCERLMSPSLYRRVWRH